jgi:hypothetical protein
MWHYPGVTRLIMNVLPVRACSRWLLGAGWLVFARRRVQQAELQRSEAAHPHTPPTGS